MAAVIESLLAAITVGVTITIVLVGFLGGQLLLQIKPTLQTVQNSLFGRPNDESDDGLVTDLERVESKLDTHADQREIEHQRVEEELAALQSRTNQIMAALRRSDEVDVNVDVNSETRSDSDANN